MPRIDYTKMEIYKISCKDAAVKYVHIGYTTCFYKKKHDHKHNCIVKPNEPLYSYINTYGGWENWEMKVLERISCANQVELDEKVNQWRILYDCPKMPQTAPNCTKIAPNSPEMPRNEPKNPLQCQCCMKIFMKKYGLNRHRREGRCKAEETIESLKERLAYQQQIIDLVKRFEQKMNENESQLVNTNSNNTNNNSNNSTNSTNNTNSNNRTNTNTINTVINNNNTIRLVGLGNENIVELLSDKEKKQILGKMHKSLIHLIEKVHFSGEYPQFANVVITNLKSKLAYKYSEDEQKFIVDTAEKVIQEVIDNHFDDICTIYEEQKDSLDKKINMRTGEFIEQHSNNPEKYKQATDDVRLMMYNKREKVDINTQKAINNT